MISIRVGHVTALAVILTVAASAGFVFWDLFLGLLFAGSAILTGLLGTGIHILGTLTKSKPNTAGFFVAFAAVASLLLAGWLVRAELREDAMVTESLRLVERAIDYKKMKGIYAHSSATLAPADSTERMISWIAGTSVRYGGYDTYFTSFEATV